MMMSHQPQVKMGSPPLNNIKQVHLAINDLNPIKKQNRSVIINIKIQNYGLHPSQRKHSLINLKG